MKNKKLAIMAVTVLLAIGSAMTAFAGQWQQDEKGWRYQNDDGSYVAQDGKDYKTGEGYDVWDGTLFADKIYKFDAAGYMVTGWIFEQYDLSQMDPKEIPYFMEDTHGYGGYWSYYHPDGSLVQFDYTPDGYWMDASGCWDFQPANLTAAAAYTAEQEAKRIAAEERNNASNNPTSIEQQEIPEDGFNYEYAEEVSVLLNDEREKVDLQPLVMTEELNEAAQTRAQEYADEFEQTGTITHTRPDGSSFSSVLKNIPHKLVAENGSKGAITPKEVVGDWMGSRIGHRQNMLESSFNQIGIGCYIKDGNYFWCLLFIQTK